MFLNRKIKFLIMIVISVSIIFLLNYKIKTDISYHSGKDGGYFKRLESVVILSVLFYVVMSKKLRILYGFMGFAIAFVATFGVLLISSFVPESLSGDTIMHLIVFLIAYSSFFVIEKIVEKVGHSQ